MKLEFINNISDGGRFEQVVTDELIRLYDFNKVEAKMFQDLIKNEIITNKNIVDLKSIDFIENINCSLILSLCDTDKGIQNIKTNHFECQLTENSYREMINLIQPFVDNDLAGYQWLYDIKEEVTPTEFLFSPGGGW